METLHAYPQELYMINNHEGEKTVDVEMLNNLALEQADRYQHLRIGRTFVNTPFFINQMQFWIFNAMQKAEIPYDQIMEVMDGYGKSEEMPFGWHKGKGSPEELEAATKQIAGYFHLDLDRATPEAAVEFMKYIGLGVDCSGFVTNILLHACEEAGVEGFLDSLDIIPNQNGEKTKYRAGVSSYIGDSVSRKIQPNEVGPLDLVIREGWHDQAWHIGIILQREDYLVLAHSTLGLTPNGVHVSWFQVKNNEPIFGFKPNLSPVDWEEYYKEGKLEFRRLRFVDKINGEKFPQRVVALGEMP